MLRTTAGGGVFADSRTLRFVGTARFINAAVIESELNPVGKLFVNPGAMGIYPNDNGAAAAGVRQGSGTHINSATGAITVRLT